MAKITIDDWCSLDGGIRLRSGRFDGSDVHRSSPMDMHVKFACSTARDAFVASLSLCNSVTASAWSFYWLLRRRLLPVATGLFASCVARPRCSLLYHTF